VGILSTKEVRASDAAALESGGESVTSGPGSVTIFREFFNEIVVFFLVVDTDIQSAVDNVAHGSKAGVVGGNKLSRKLTVEPVVITLAPAALKVRLWLVV